MLEVISESEATTRQLGTAIGESIVDGALIALIGNLGAGKTQLTRAISIALGVDPAAVSSPTFVLIHEYEGRRPVYHFDAYRLRSVAEFVDLGADELMQDDCVCLIEWADRVASALPTDRLQITISILSATQRGFAFEALGPQSDELLMRIGERTKV